MDFPAAHALHPVSSPGDIGAAAAGRFRRIAADFRLPAAKQLLTRLAPHYRDLPRRTAVGDADDAGRRNPSFG